MKKIMIVLMAMISLSFVFQSCGDGRDTDTAQNVGQTSDESCINPVDLYMNQSGLYNLIGNYQSAIVFDQVELQDQYSKQIDDVLNNLKNEDVRLYYKVNNEVNSCYEVIDVMETAGVHNSLYNLAVAYWNDDERWQDDFNQIEQILDDMYEDDKVDEEVFNGIVGVVNGFLSFVSDDSDSNIEAVTNNVTGEYFVNQEIDSQQGKDAKDVFQDVIDWAQLGGEFLVAVFECVSTVQGFSNGN